MFAKTFDSPTMGQLLLMITGSEEPGMGYALHLSFRPAGLGVCTVQAHYRDCEEADIEAHAHFENADLAWMEQHLASSFEAASKMATHIAKQDEKTCH